MKNNNVSIQNNYERLWYTKFNELCYEVFYKNPFGRELLQHMESRYFRSPIATPGLDPSWAFFNEGRNEHIRSYTAAIQTHINTHQVKEENKKPHRRAKLKPLVNKE